MPKGLLPVGSSIMIEEGYQYRIIFLEKTDDGYKVLARTANFTDPYKYINESFWGDYKYISFNISTVPTSDINERLDEVAGMLTLYQPSGTLDNHIDYDLAWENGFVAQDDTSVTASDNYLISTPLTPEFYDYDTVIEVADGYKFAYVVYSFENQVYTATFVSEFQTESLWVDPVFAEGKAIIGFIVTTTAEDTAILVDDIDTIVDMHPNAVPHNDEELFFVTGYWADNATEIATGDTDFHLKFAASNVLSKHYFENVSEIIVPDGYTLKPIFLSYDGYGNYAVTSRGSALTGTITLDAAFWGENMYIAFNYSNVAGTNISAELDSLGSMLSFTVADMVFSSGYWGSGATEIFFDDSDFAKKYAASNVTPRQFIPAGTVIDITAGYKLKAIFLQYSAEDGYKVLYRTGEFTGEFILTDAMYKDYQYIAFNMSLDPAADISGELATLPNQFTMSMFSDELVAHVDEALSFSSGYWNDSATAIFSDGLTFADSFGASNVLSKAYFDGKASIDVAAGYQLKVIYLGYDHNTYSVVYRSGNQTGSIVLDDAFWGDYEYIAFNISSVPSSDLSGVLATLPSYVTFVDAVI